MRVKNGPGVKPEPVLEGKSLLVAGQVSPEFTQVSPPEGETWEGGKVPIYREQQLLSLHISPFHPYTPARSPRARIRVCVCEGG